ncbi:hypothetical protein JCM16408A_09040 [Methylobacterium phyllosphaerae]
MRKRPTGGRFMEASSRSGIAPETLTTRSAALTEMRPAPVAWFMPDAAASCRNVASAPFRGPAGRQPQKPPNFALRIQCVFKVGTEPLFSAPCVRLYLTLT